MATDMKMPMLKINKKAGGLSVILGASIGIGILHSRRNGRVGRTVFHLTRAVGRFFLREWRDSRDQRVSDKAFERSARGAISDDGSERG